MPETEMKRSVAAMIRRPLLAGALAATAAVAPGVADAAQDIFLDLRPDILGESTDKAHGDQINILAFSLGFFNQPAGGTAGGGAGKVSCGDINVQKLIDKSSPALIGAVMTGKHIPTGRLHFTVAGKGGPAADYYTLSLTDLLVTSISQSDSVGGEKVFESVSISAAKFKFEYKQQKSDGSFFAARTFTFDCKTNKAG